MKPFRPLLSVLFLLLVIASSNAQVVYVDADANGSNDGSSWDNAYSDLTDALDAAPAGAELWIAEGTYTPTTSSLPDSNWFALKRSLSLYGGFVGNETSLDQRNPAAHPTRLSGDVNGDDVAGNFDVNRADNALHVLFCISDTIDQLRIDGLIVSNGNASMEKPAIDTLVVDTFSQEVAGGGLFCRSAVSILNCQFEQNQGNRGAGIAVYDAELLIEDCVIENNFSALGACWVRDNPQAIIQSCEVRNNAVDDVLNEFGGGLTIGNCNALIADCHFEGHQGNFGAGIFTYQNVLSPILSPEVQIKRCTLSGNSGLFGAGLSVSYYISGASIDIDSCLFENNLAFQGGGAIVMQNHSQGVAGRTNFTIQHSVFRENQAQSFAGALHFFINQPDSLALEVENCLFESNTAANSAGAVELQNYRRIDAPVFRNCNFSQNTCTGFGGGAMRIGNSQIQLDQCRFSGNSAQGGGAIFGFANLLSGISNPELTISRTVFGKNETTQSQGGAIAFNNFHHASRLTIDSCTMVNNESANSGGGLALINVGDTAAIEVQISRSNISFNSATSSGGGLSVRNGSGGQPDSLRLYITASVFSENTADNSAGVVLSGFEQLDEPVLFDCNLTGNVSANSFGGGLTAGNGSYLFENCTISENSGTEGGGFFFFQNNSSQTEKAQIRVMNCQFSDNATTVGSGGGIGFNNFSPGSQFEVDSCRFTGNTSNSSGGGMSVNNLASDNGPNGTIQVAVRQSLFDENFASIGGGGLIFQLSVGDSMEYEVDSCLFRDNNAALLGGGAFLTKATPFDSSAVGTFSRCTFSGNSGGGCCGGLANYSSDVVLDSCLFENNLTDATLGGIEGGGALGMNGSNSQILNTRISDNESALLGGGLFFLNDPLLPKGQIRIENVLMENNSANNAVYGVLSQQLDFVNVTIIDDGTAVALADSSIATFQNTLLSATTNLQIVDSAFVDSRGGNLSTDSSMVAFLQGFDGFEDQHGADPLLDMDFVPMMGSPCIDAGNPDGLTQNIDLAGNARIQGSNVDIGALESDFIVSARQPDASHETSWKVFPNPASVATQLSWEQPLTAPATLQLVDAAGRILQHQKLPPGTKEWRVSLSGIPSGNYLLRFTREKKESTRTLIKQ